MNSNPENPKNQQNPAETQRMVIELDAIYPGVADLVRRHETARQAGAELPDLELHPLKTRWTRHELATAEFPEPKWAVPNLLPVGLTFLAGRPKIGKSWLSLQLAHAVATGGMAMGERVEKGRVLYIALEDSPRRLKGRCTKQGVPMDADITFELAYDSLASGGLVNLQNEITTGKYRLVIVDTFSRSIGKSDQLDPGEMTFVTGNLQRMAQNLDIAILIIDHHRKPYTFGADPIDDILGSTAKAAVIDTAWGLYRESGKHEATLKAVSREMEPVELALEWDGQMCCWQSLGNSDDVREDTVKGDILRAIRELAEDGEIPTGAKIAKHIDSDPSNVHRVLGELIAAGRVKRGPKDGRNVPYMLIQ